MELFFMYKEGFFRERCITVLKLKFFFLSNILTISIQTKTSGDKGVTGLRIDGETSVSYFLNILLNYVP